MNSWKPILAALVIFAAGVVTGGLTVNLRTKPQAPGLRAFEQRASPAQNWDNRIRELGKRMERQLDLTAEQRGRIETIVRESQRRIKGVFEEVAPKAREEFRETRMKIREVLTPEQRKKFEELFKVRDGGGKRGENPTPVQPPADRP